MSGVFSSWWRLAIGMIVCCGGLCVEAGSWTFDRETWQRSLRALRKFPHLEQPKHITERLSPLELMEVVQLVSEAFAINMHAQEREAEHRRKLAAKGIAEVPPTAANRRYRLDTGGNSFIFDLWGNFWIDRRFVTDEEMKVIHKLERYYRKALGLKPRKKNPKRPDLTVRPEVRNPLEVPVFAGFEAARYQAYDDLIVQLVVEFNADKEGWIGGTSAQAETVDDLTPALVKSQMIEESGGNGKSSLAAWAVDPLQVNVPGDWDEAKHEVGLVKPKRRNEGDLENNVRAAIMFLVRKGFGVSGQPAGIRVTSYFDGWPEALRRYNARRDRTIDGRIYSEAYAEKICRRAAHPERFEPIEIRLPPRVEKLEPTDLSRYFENLELTEFPFPLENKKEKP